MDYVCFPYLFSPNNQNIWINASLGSSTSLTKFPFSGPSKFSLNTTPCCNNQNKYINISLGYTSIVKFTLSGPSNLSLDTTPSCNVSSPSTCIHVPLRWTSLVYSPNPMGAPSLSYLLVGSPPSSIIFPLTTNRFCILSSSNLWYISLATHYSLYHPSPFSTLKYGPLSSSSC